MCWSHLFGNCLDRKALFCRLYFVIGVRSAQNLSLMSSLERICRLNCIVKKQICSWKLFPWGFAFRTGRHSSLYLHGPILQELYCFWDYICLFRLFGPTSRFSFSWKTLRCCICSLEGRILLGDAGGRKAPRRFERFEFLNSFGVCEFRGRNHIRPLFAELDGSTIR